MTLLSFLQVMATVEIDSVKIFDTLTPMQQDELLDSLNEKQYSGDEVVIEQVGVWQPASSLTRTHPHTHPSSHTLSLTHLSCFWLLAFVRRDPRTRCSISSPTER